MNTLVFFAVLAVIAIPLVLFGWWLGRHERSMGGLAEAMNQHGVTLGEFRIGGSARGWLLLADPRFMFLVVLRRYRDRELPKPVVDAFDSARSDYLKGMAIYTTLIVLVFMWAVISNP